MKWVLGPLLLKPWGQCAGSGRAQVVGGQWKEGESSGKGGPVEGGWGMF